MQKLTIKKTALLTLLALLSFSMAGCGAQNEDAAQDSTEPELVKIGVIAPLTGDAAAYGQEMEHILDWALPQVNAEAKANGFEFELVYEDDQCGAGASSAFQKLTTLDEVSYIIGGGCSSESLAIAPLLEEKNVIAISSLSSSPEIKGLSPNLMSLSCSDSGVAENIAKELSKYAKVAILTEQIDYSMAIQDGVTAALKADLDTSVQIEVVPQGTTDFRNVLQKIKASDPDVLFLNPNVGVTAETLLKQMAEIKDWEVEKVGSITVMNVNYLALVPELLEGFVAIDTPKITSADLLSAQKSIEEANGSVENLGAYYTASTLDALKVFAEAITKAGNDPIAVLNTLRADTFNGYIGAIKFGEETFVQGIGVSRYTVKDGTWIEEQ